MPTSPEIFVTLDQPIADDAVKQLASDLSEALGEDRLVDFDGTGGIALEPKSEHDLLPQQLPRTKSILTVRLCTPYYGEGYERGYWPEIAATLEFLRHRLPEARVWYGPGGTEHVVEVDALFLDKCWDYWSRNGGRPYYDKQKNAQHLLSPRGQETK